MRSYHEQDYYELLELTPEATQEEIAAAYARLKSVFAENASATFMLFGDDEAASMRDMLDAAYATLSDHSTRNDYDTRIGVKRSRPLHSSDSTSSTQPVAEVVAAPATPQLAVDAHDDIDARISQTSRSDQSARITSAKASTAAEASLTAPLAAKLETTQAEPAATPPEAQSEAGSEPSAVVAPTVVASTVASSVASSTRPTPAPETPSARPQWPQMVEGPPQDSLSESMEYGGQVLTRLRENRGISIEAIAQRTKITLTHLRAIEANQYDKLPARVYVRGFVTQYARFLGLPGDRVAESYLQIYDRFFQNRT